MVDSPPVRSSSKTNQRGATLAGYALVLSTFTFVSLGAVEGLNSASDTYLTETSEDIAASRELAFYDELEEIPDATGDGGDTGEDEDDDATFEFEDSGQFQSPSDGLCMTVESDNKFRQRECDGSAEQQISVFKNEETGAFQLRVGDQCIGLENNLSTNGDDYLLQDCDDDNANQLFRRNEVDQTWESASNRDPVMCLDVTGGGGEGQVVHQWTCHGGDNQEWPDPSPYVPPIPDPPTPVITGEGIFVGPIPDGTDLSPNASYEDDDNVFVFTESVVVLTSDLDVGTATIPAGTTVCSYIVWYDPVSNNDVVTSIDFGDPILGGSLSSSDLQNTNMFAVDGVNYDYSRQWESDDEFNVSGSTLGITPYAVTNNADMLRVFTECG